MPVLEGAICSPCSGTYCHMGLALGQLGGEDAQMQPESLKHKELQWWCAPV